MPVTEPPTLVPHVLTFFSRSNPQCLHRRVKNGSKAKAERKKRFAHLGQGQVPICHTKNNHCARHAIRSSPNEKAIAIRRTTGGWGSPCVETSSNAETASPPANQNRRIRRRRLSV